MADLADMLRQAAGDGDAVTVARVATYVCWAASHTNDEGLQSAIDLAFFLPAFRNPELLALLIRYFPDDLIREKWSLLMEEPNLLIHKESPAAQE